MSSSSRILADSHNSKVDLPVFITPNELVFSPRERCTLLTIFNPYDSDAQFKIMTTNPDRFDVSSTKGIIKTNRRIDITIRLVNNKIDDLPNPTDELQIIDHFRISMQVASLRGSKQIKVHWCASIGYSDNEDSMSRVNSMGNDDRTQKVKIKSSRQPLLNSTIQTNSPSLLNSHNQRTFQQQTRSSAIRARSQLDHPANNGSNINLVCFLCAIICVIPLFLPLAIDSELCKKAKLYPDNNLNNSAGLFSQLSNLLSVSYEMKFGCSFALGLFTYRLISTMPD